MTERRERKNERGELEESFAKTVEPTGSKKQIAHKKIRCTNSTQQVRFHHKAPNRAPNPNQPGGKSIPGVLSHPNPLHPPFILNGL